MSGRVREGGDGKEGGREGREGKGKERKGRNRWLGWMYGGREGGREGVCICQPGGIQHSISPVQSSPGETARTKA